MKPEIKQLRDKLKGLGLNGMIVSNKYKILNRFRCRRNFNN